MTQATDIATARREIDRLNTALYSGQSRDRAFAHWALKCLLADLDPDDEDIRDRVAIGRSGDLGIDGYWDDDVNSRIILLQAKDSPVSRGHVQEFRSSVEMLLDAQWVTQYGNAELRSEYATIQNCLLNDSYSIYAIVAAGGRIATAARGYSQGEGSAPLDVEDGDVIHVKDFTLQVFDIPELIAERHILSTGGTPIVDLPLVRTSKGQAFHYMGGQYESALATVPATSLAEAYEEHRGRIFRFNPRGPQGSNKVNSSVEKTLNDDMWKSYFHMLNNGITIVCDGLVIDEERIRITNCQIVNGCQTVYTLHSAVEKLTPEVLVNVRIIEGASLRSLIETIAEASNSQTAVKAEQLVSPRPEHDAIVRAFESLDPPWRYEKQLGQVRFLSPVQRRSMKDKYADRIVNITEVGQNGAAFLGYPGLASYNLKALFEKERPGSHLYQSLFLGITTAEQLILPVAVARRVSASVKARLAELRSSPSQQIQVADLDWLPYARLHFVGLIGYALRQSAGQQSDGSLLSPEISKQRLDTIEEWYPDLHKKAYEAAGNYITAVNNTTEGLVNLRNFFRNVAHYQAMEAAMLRQI